MAMYYYARKIQKAAAKKHKSPSPPPTRAGTGSGQGTGPPMCNGSIPSTIINQHKPAPPGTAATAANTNASTAPTNSTSSSSSSPSSTTVTSGGAAAAGATTYVNVNGNGRVNGAQDNLNDSSITNGAGGGVRSGAGGASSALTTQSVETNFVNGQGSLTFHKTTTLEAGIQRLCPTVSYYPDRAYIFAFLLSSRLHISPPEVLGAVFSPVLSPTAQLFRKHKSPDEVKLASLMVQLMGEWTEMFPYDFRDERMMAHVRTFTEQCVTAYPHVKDEVSELLTSLLARLETLERYEALTQRLTSEIGLISPLNTPSILTICPTPLVLAQQLTLIELESLSHVGAEEFLHGFLPQSQPQGHESAQQTDSSGSTSSTSTSTLKHYSNTTKKPRNLEAYLQWHYRLTFYVATEVCKVPKRKLRAKVIEHWIQTAGECFNIGNFNSLMGIIMGLNLSPVQRLKKTWSKVQGSQLSQLEKQMSPSDNYGTYRKLFQNRIVRTPRAASSSSEERHQVPIPLLPLFLKDVSITIEECSVKLLNRQLNFGSFWQLAKQVTEFIGSQQMTLPTSSSPPSSHPFPKVQSVITSLQSFQIFTEPVLLSMSYELEPPTSRQEKEQCKVLRGECERELEKNGTSSTGESTTSTSTSTSRPPPLPPPRVI